MDKRKRLAAVCLLCFVVLAVFLLTNRLQDLVSNPAFSFFFKLAVSAGVLWLAWPDLVRLKDHFPPKFLILAPIALAWLLIQPRMGAGIVGLLVVYWLGWSVFRKVFPDRRVKKNTKNTTKPPAKN